MYSIGLCMHAPILCMELCMELCIMYGIWDVWYLIFSVIDVLYACHDYICTCIFLLTMYY